MEDRVTQIENHAGCWIVRRLSTGEALGMFDSHGWAELFAQHIEDLAGGEDSMAFAA